MTRDPLREKLAALVEAWEAHAQHPACRGERGSGVRSCIAEVRALLDAEPAPADEDLDADEPMPIHCTCPEGFHTPGEGCEADE